MVRVLHWATAPKCQPVRREQPRPAQDVSGAEVVDEVVHPPLPRNQGVTVEYWVTRNIATPHMFTVYVDSSYHVSEAEEDDNSCSYWYNPT